MLKGEKATARQLFKSSFWAMKIVLRVVSQRAADAKGKTPRWRARVREDEPIT
jgi:hypothetical protein